MNIIQVYHPGLVTTYQYKVASFEFPGTVTNELYMYHQLVNVITVPPCSVFVTTYPNE